MTFFGVTVNVISDRSGFACNVDCKTVRIFCNVDMHAFLHCLSRQNYIAKSGVISVNKRFFGY